MAVTLRSQRGAHPAEREGPGPRHREESQERIFKRFERAISANDVSGLGLGLFISRQIVEAPRRPASGWRARALAAGATFFVELPAFPDFNRLKLWGADLGGTRPERRFQGRA